MPIEIRRAKLSDATAIASIFTAARAPNNALDQACYPNGLSEAEQQARVNIFHADLQDPSRTFFIVEDTQAGSSEKLPVSFMEWRTGTVQSMKSEDMQHASEGSLYKLGRNDSIEKLVEDTNAGWEKYMADRRHIRLEELYTLPSYERRGIASSLLGMLKKHADEQQLPVFMEAVAFAKNLYLRRGFTVLKEYVAYIPYRGMEGLHPYSNWHMLREPMAHP